MELSRRVRMTLATCWSLAACGPERGEAIEHGYAEVCGVEGPVQILALDDDEFVNWRGTMVEGETWYVLRHRYAEPLVDASSDKDHRPPDVVGTLLERMDECGEQRAPIAADVERVAHRGAPGEPWAVEMLDGTLAWVDPTGGRAPIPIAIEGTWASYCAGDVVGTDAAGDLIRLSYDAPDEPVVLAPHIRGAASFAYDSSDPRITAVDGSGAYFEYALCERTVIPLLSGVGYAAADIQYGRSRWSLWAPLAAIDELGDAHEIWRLDRASGESVRLAADPVTQLQAAHSGDWGMLMRRGDAARTAELVWLPGDLRLAVTPTTVIGGASVTDDAMVVFDFPNAYRVTVEGDALRQTRLDLPPLSVGNTVSEPFAVVDIQEGAVLAAAFYPYAQPGVPDWELPSDVYRVPLGRGPTELLRRGAISQLALPGDRWASVRFVHESTRLGELWVLDDHGDYLDRIDTDVHLGADSYPDRLIGAFPVAVDDLVYQVRDPGRPRNGLWRVAFE